jgi:hypothetical protein
MSTESEFGTEEVVETSSDETQDEKDETQEVETEAEETEEEVVEEEEEEKPLSRAEQRIKEALAERDAYKRLAEANTYRPRQEEKEEALPEMDPEVETAVNARLSKVQRQHQQQLGQIVEQLDEAKAEVKIPHYAEHAEKINTYREEKAARGVYFTRQEAYDLLKGQGKIKETLTKKRTVIVSKSKPKTGIERKTVANSKVASKKAFAQMTFEEKEKALENKTF